MASRVQIMKLYDRNEGIGSELEEKKLEQVKNILKKPQDQRTGAELKVLASYIKSIKFFQDLTDKRKKQLKDKDIELICSGLNRETLVKGKTVMRYGD